MPTRHFYAYLLGGRPTPPDIIQEAQISRPFIRAMNRNDRGDFSGAQQSFVTGVANYNRYARISRKYYAALHLGADRAIFAIQVIEFVVSALPVGKLTKAGSMLWGIGYTLATSSTREGAEIAMGLDTKFDFFGIGKDTLAGLAGSLIGGKLSGWFRGKLQTFVSRHLGNKFAKAEGVLVEQGLDKLFGSSVADKAADISAQGASSLLLRVMLHTARSGEKGKLKSFDAFMDDTFKAMSPKELELISRAIELF